MDDVSMPMAGEVKLTAPPKATTAAAPASMTTNTVTAMSATTTPAAATVSVAVPVAGANGASAKTLKRCLSVPIIHTPPPTAMTTRSAAAAAALARTANACSGTRRHQQSSGDQYHHSAALPDSCSGSGGGGGGLVSGFGHSSIHIGIPRSNPSSREVSPAPVFNIFTPRARRYSASYSPHGAAATAAGTAGCGASPLCLTPRVSQLRQEECADLNSREVNHEREVHSAMQMSQSWEDLTLVAENWSCKSDEFSNALQVVLPAGITSCSSPSPTSNRAGLRLPYGLSPSPTRRTFATRRSMSPIAMRPSQLGPVKRKFELDDNNSASNWNVYSPPPLKKIFTESRGSSPVCQSSPSSVCPSPPDSGTYDGRITPKLFISKLCTTTHNSSSACSSPMSAASPSGSSCLLGAIDSTATSGVCSSSSSSCASSVCSGSGEPMCIGSAVDEAIVAIGGGSGPDEKPSSTASANAPARNIMQATTLAAEDDATLMDDMKSETSSIGGCSSVSAESSSCDSGAKSAANFFNRLNVDDMAGGNGGGVVSTTSTAGSLGQKNFFLSGRKYIVNHDNLPNSSSNSSDAVSTAERSIKVSSTTATAPSSGGMKTRRSNVLRIAAATVSSTANSSGTVGADAAELNAISASVEATASEANALIVDNKM